MKTISRFRRVSAESLRALLVAGVSLLLFAAVFPPLGQGAETLVPGEAQQPGEPRVPAQAQRPIVSWQVGVSGYYTTGKYGTDVRTNTLYVPANMRRLFDNGDITLVIPYVTITSNCSVTLVNGVPLRTGGLCPSTTPSGGTFPKRVTESGLGDVLLIGRYYVYTEREPGILPSLMISGRLKAPTADKDRGLGTGEFDEGGSLGLTKLITTSFVLFADAGYTIIGKPSGSQFRNQWSYDAGAGYYITRSFLVSVFYEEARALVSGFQNPRDIFAAFSWTITPTFRLNAGFEKGVSHGAPDYGGSLGISYRF